MDLDFEIDWSVEHDPHYFDVPVREIGKANIKAIQTARSEAQLSEARPRPPPECNEPKRPAGRPPEPPHRC